jgi:hypothetical protein
MNLMNTLPIVKKINKFLFLVFILSCVMYSCTKTEDGLTEATIIGYDLRLCACCGGVMVKLNEKQNDIYQWQQRIESFGVKPTDSFPQKVKIKYHFLVNTCVASAGEIEITELVKIK